MENCIKNVESDVYANIYSDHYPVWATYKLKLRKNVKFQPAKPKYIKPNKEDAAKFNSIMEEKLRNIDPRE